MLLIIQTLIILSQQIDNNNLQSEIEIGCDEINPFLCSDQKCVSNHSLCTSFAGCVYNHLNIITSDAQCLQNGLENIQKPERCLIDSQTRCDDGICWFDCQYIKTQGCPISKPFLCPIGKCVNDIKQCSFSFCPLDKPILCFDLTCNDQVQNCKQSIQHLSFEQVSLNLLRDINSFQRQILFLKDQQDGSFQLAKIQFKNWHLFTKEEQLLDLMDLQSGSEININITCLPFVQFQESKLRQEEFNYFANQFSNILFNQDSVILDSVYFIRSVAIEVDIPQFLDQLYWKEIWIAFTFNNIQNNTMIYQFNQQMKKNHSIQYQEISFKNLLCLGLYNKQLNQWSCLDNTFEDLSEQQITFKIPFNGIYSVIINPELLSLFYTKQKNFLFFKSAQALLNGAYVLIGSLMLIFLVNKVWSQLQIDTHDQYQNNQTNKVKLTKTQFINPILIEKKKDQEDFEGDMKQIIEQKNIQLQINYIIEQKIQLDEEIYMLSMEKRKMYSNLGNDF